jgi:hypothetical protein
MFISLDLLPFRIAIRVALLISLAAAATASLQGQRFQDGPPDFHFVTCPDSQKCITFDRPHNRILGEPALNATLPPNSLNLGIAGAVVASKIIFSGTVLRVETRVDCTQYLWTVVTQTNESSNVLIYNPADIGSEYCDYQTPQPAKPQEANPTVSLTDDVDRKGHLKRVPAEVPSGRTWVYLPLPVHVVWAEVIGYKVVQGDSFHKLPQKLPTTANSNCEALPNPPSLPPTIFVNPLDTEGSALKLCDQHQGLLRLFYKSGSIYNVLIQPGTGSGAVSYTPVIGSGKASYSFDVQVDPTFRISKADHWWNGWIGMPVVLEKSGTQNGNLDSLVGALSYEIHPEPNGNILPRRTSAADASWSPVVLRAVQFQVRSGVE